MKSKCFSQQEDFMYNSSQMVKKKISPNFPLFLGIHCKSKIVLPLSFKKIVREIVKKTCVISFCQKEGRLSHLIYEQR